MSEINADVNGDGTVDIHDVNELTGALLKGDKSPEYDVNKDGRVDIGDLADTIDASLNPTPAWVSVEERLPPRAENSFTFSDYVLVCDNIGYMDTACYNFEKNRWDWLNNVTHWMPLPQPPVKKGGER